MPIGIAEAGAWRYSYRYELTARHFPDLLEQARSIGEAEARRKLIELYLHSVGAAQTRDLEQRCLTLPIFFVYHPVALVNSNRRVI